MQVKQTQHKVSEFLADRHPFLEEEKSDKLQVCVALGRRGIAKLADILRDDSQTDAEVGAGLELMLKLLTTQEKKIEAINNGVVQAATVIMGGDGVSAGTRASAGLVLASLVQVMQGRSALKRAKTVPVLTKSCLDDDFGVRMAASSALTFTTSFRDGWAIVMDTSRAVRNLVMSMDAHPQSISVFANLTSFFDEGCVEALKHGVMPKIVAVMRDTKDGLLRRFAAMTLRNIVNNDVGKEKAIRYGAVDAAVDILRDEDPLVRGAAAGAIQTICVNQEAKPIFLDNETAVADMSALLRDPSEDVRSNATLAIRNLSDLPDAKTAFVGALVGELDLLQSVFGSGCAQPLCELLENDSAEVRGHAARAFGAFTGSDAGRVDCVNALHIIRRLVAVLCDEEQDSSAKRAAASALQALCGQYKDAQNRLKALARGESGETVRRALHGFAALRTLALAE